MMRQFKKETYEKRLEKAEQELTYARALVAAWDKAQQDKETDSLEIRIKKMYYRERNIKYVGECALEEIEGFAPNKAKAYARVKEIINTDCGDNDLDIAARAIFDENSYYAMKYGY